MKHIIRIAATTSQIPCSADKAWETVCFYEHVQRKPSWLLRMVLPVPEYTTGCHGAVGDESRCLYSDGGYLTKRLTQVVDGQRVDFEIIEQTIRYHDSIRLKGGTIEIVAEGRDACTVRMITRYELQLPLLTLIRPFIGFTISAMHRFVMRDMLNRLYEKPPSFSHNQANERGASSPLHKMHTKGSRAPTAV